MKKPNDTQFDAIVIGSGMGGLAAASLLAQIGRKRVLVVERHFKLGGFTHSFRRQKYEWDVGVHYVGEMHDGALTRRMMDLVTRGQVKWNKMGSLFERFMFPEGTFEVPDDRREFEAKLIARFPAEGPLIKQYFKDVLKAQSWVIRWFIAKVYSKPISSLLGFGDVDLIRMTTADYLKRFQDPLLRGILAAQWPDFGSPPTESAFGIHATVTADFFHGGYYPIGGAKELAHHMVAAIEDQGGCCVVNHEVKQINVRDGVACGITAVHKGVEVEYRAPVIISNASSKVTFEKLVAPEYCREERAKSKRLKKGTSAVILFLGLNDDPRQHGFDDANYWAFDRVDHDVEAARKAGSGRQIHGTFVTFGSLRNPGQYPHVAQVISFTDESIWNDFADSEWLNRGDEYERLKEKIADEMLDFAEKYMPGLRALVDYQELSTPLTVETFTGHPGGMIYGQACDENRLFRDQWPIKTSLRNLYLTGSDVGTPGVNGALMAGVMTAAKLLGPFGMPRIMARGFAKRYNWTKAKNA